MPTIEFGFYPRPYDARFADVEIQTRQHLNGRVAGVTGSAQVVDRWCHAPPRARVFGMPRTHQLEVDEGGEGRAEYLVQCFGFLVGMRMSTTDAGFLDATPMGEHELTDFTASHATITRCLEHADDLWKRCNQGPRTGKYACAAIHALMMSQTPTLLTFEVFIYLYIAIEACYKMQLCKKSQEKSKTSHAERIAELCEELGTVKPRWVRCIVEERNDTIHEGLFFGAPLGFHVFGEQHPELGPDVLLEMRKLVCRFIIALLDIPDRDYISSSIDCGQISRLQLR